MSSHQPECKLHSQDPLLKNGREQVAKDDSTHLKTSVPSFLSSVVTELHLPEYQDTSSHPRAFWGTEVNY